MTLKEKFKLYILHLLPKNLFSRFMGFLAELPLPAFFLEMVISLFVRSYKVNMEESAQSVFVSFNDFFTRPLLAQCRPIASSDVVSPVDGVVGHCGPIDKQELFQAKGLSYSLEEFLGRREYVKTFNNGYYVTLYLSPRHYHRIHAPVSGTIESLYYIPGTLYPVNPFAVCHIPRLFAKNERLISIINSKEMGRVAVVKVGATVVGKIKVVYDSIESNKAKTPIYKTYENLTIEKGEELGRFQLGSTVILLFEKDNFSFHRQEGTDVLYGENLSQK